MSRQSRILARLAAVAGVAAVAVVIVPPAAAQAATPPPATTCSSSTAVKVSTAAGLTAALAKAAPGTQISLAPGTYTAYVATAFSGGNPIWSSGKSVTARSGTTTSYSVP